MGKLFGTDGIRGKANEYPMTAEVALNVGRAVAALFRTDPGRSKIVLGKDTRISGDMIAYALVSGVCSMGVDALVTGILPTPAVAYLASSTGSNAGIMISASHNPFYDNGIKIFNGTGYKLADAKEELIETLVLGEDPAAMCGTVRNTGSVHSYHDAANQYADFLKGALPEGSPLKGINIVADCANGATSEVGPRILRDLGANVTPLFASPDGKNINEDCGSEHPEILSKTVVETRADIGLAFDGDGDRLIAVDEKGKVITGDQILAICAKFMKASGRLEGNVVVSTIMSNMGLRMALDEMDIAHVACKVGDRYVMEALISSGGVLGGEDSGHMIFLDRHTTGDGILTALRLIEAMKAESEPLSELRKIMTVFPQALINVDVTQKPDIQTIPAIADEIKSVEARLGKRGRVLVRYSGTQPLCRVMVEGPTMDTTRGYCRQIADIIKEKLG